ncbi:sce7726 family protein [Vibrio coralliilyticus]|uniref:sce7726 family protein n=1 Tax=Vibrio coralliilyticus TaxID=190893 RepID=UPI002409854B|nr:sce7726 family protein [Vibrio coralliilyticus]WFB47847.1 sce7726 family protein [Vibrio coralliilyticus]
MNDIDVRKAVHKKLLKKYHDDPSTLIVDELGICLGACRVDIAVLNGSLHGYELKSEKDTLERLPSQIQHYSSVMDKVTLVVAESHLDEAKEIIPDWWGIKVVTKGSKGAIHISHERAEKKNKHIDSFNLAQLLWKDECVHLLDKWGLAKGYRSKARHLLWPVISEGIPGDTLRDEVRTILKQRTEWKRS